MKHLLFVDNDKSILDGLKRMLRPYHKIWDLKFVTSGTEALEAMDVKPFDVIVTEMKMPKMDGSSLLKKVQERHPGTVRIVLTGHSDLEASMRSASVSHQFLTKPCEARILKQVIERSCNLEALLSDEGLQRVVGNLRSLPVLPKTYKLLADLLAQSDVDLDAIGEVVEQDPAITAKIVQLVNSAFFGIRREIVSVRQATTYLGLNTIRDLVLSFGVFQQFANTQQIKGFSLAQEQHHTLLTAQIARRLVEDKTASEQAFLAAMLHDVGKLVMAASLPGKLEAVIKAGAGRERSFHEVETEILGVSHSKIGAYLLGLWGMPYPIVEAVAYHHAPGSVVEPSEFGVLGATHVADFLAREQDDAHAVGLDEDFLETVNASENLPAWREIALEEAGCPQESS